ncbi:MAG TPA: hypothetical protein VNA13_04545 [Xanthomonadales bacterium]|nr:hypothetical protein [Xanthomonadales bacterium]
MRENRITKSEQLRKGTFTRTVSGTLPEGLEQLSVRIPVGEIIIYGSESLHRPTLTATLSVPANSREEGREKLNWKKGKLLVKRPEPNTLEIDGSKEKGLDGLTEYNHRGLDFMSWGGADSISLTLGKKDLLELNGEPFELEEGEERTLEAPYISRRVEIGIPTDTELHTDIRMGKGLVELSGLKGDSSVETSTAVVDIIDHDGDVNIDTYGSPITIIDFKGNLVVAGSFVGYDFPSVDIDGFDGTANIRLSWSGEGSVLLREGTVLGSGSNISPTPETVPHGAPLRKPSNRKHRRDTFKQSRPIVIKREPKGGLTSSAIYAR